MNRDGFVTPTNIFWNKVHERFQVKWDTCCARPQISRIVLVVQLHTVCPGKGSDFQWCHVASLPLFVPLNSISIWKFNLPCDDGKLAEAAAELKSANPPNGSVDPPRKRRKSNAVTGLCNNPLQELCEGFIKKTCSVFGKMDLLICSLSQHCFSCSSPHRIYTSLSKDTLVHSQLSCRSCSFVLLRKNYKMQVFAISKEKFREIKEVNKFLTCEGCYEFESL